MDRYKIAVMGGLGHIGLIQSGCLAKLGHQVIALDISKEKLDMVLKGKMPFYEPGLSQLVLEGIDQGVLKFTTQAQDLSDCEIAFICVGTPPLPNGEADLSQVFSAVELLARKINNHCLTVIKSTVPVGTSRKITKFLNEQGLTQKITMISNPEFLREGSGVQDFWEPARIVVGGIQEEDLAIIAELYAPPKVPIIKTSWENAELIKYASNTFLATKISFINEISLLCEKVGGDIRVISKGIGLDPRINPHFIEAGVGFSGPCLEKDLKSLISQFKQLGQDPRILTGVWEVNEGQRRSIIEKLQGQIGPLQGKPIGVLGMAFKAETDDVRDSHSLPIVKQLLALGAVVTVTDPWVKSAQEGGISDSEVLGVEWVSCPYEGARDKEAIVILTAWPQYRNLDLKKIKEIMKKPIIIDGRNLFDRQEMQELEIIYLGVGI